MHIRNLIFIMVSSLLIISSVEAKVINGTINNVTHSGTIIKFGSPDGESYPINGLWWSGNIQFHDGDGLVAFAEGVTNITQITDASIFEFMDISGEFAKYGHQFGIGEFAVFKNHSNQYGVLRIDDIHFMDPGNPEIPFNKAFNGTWWFQTDGTGNFASAVPEPKILQLFGVGILVLMFYRTRQKRFSVPSFS